MATVAGAVAYPVSGLRGGVDQANARRSHGVPTCASARNPLVSKSQGAIRLEFRNGLQATQVRTSQSSKGLRWRACRKPVQVNAVQSETASIISQHELHGGAMLSVSIQDQTVLLRCSPPANASGGWHTPSLVMHWGVTEAGSNEWKVPGNSTWPPGTTEYKAKALRTSFTAENPSAPHGGDYVCSITVDKTSTALVFCLIDQQTQFWHKAPSDSDFKIPLSFGSSSGGSADVAVPEELSQVFAFLNWEKAGRPALSPEESLAAFRQAQKDVAARLASGETLAALLKESGLDPSLAGSVPPAPAPPAPKAPARKAPAVVEKVPESLRNKYAYMKWEEAGNPDGADFGAAAEEELARALARGLTLNEIEGLIDDRSKGKTGAERLNVAPASTNGNGNGHKAAPSGGGGGGGGGASAAQLLSVEIRDYGVDALFEKEGGISGGEGGTPDWMINKIVDSEPGCEKSFMHRFNTASDLLEESLGSDDEGSFAALFVWLRFSALRQLVWNKNYNIKPREIAQAQERLTGILQRVYKEKPYRRELVRWCMSTVGRGGEGNGGQRIRDEILDIQRANNCMGGFMEEWHQKLHNNTTPDDVVICQALLDYIDSGLKLDVFWNTLNTNGIDKQRMLSYDRKIGGEPKFDEGQRGGLKRDLTKYLQTLKAVHSGADLNSAASYVFGYSQAKCKGSEVHVKAVSEVASPRLKELLEYCQAATEANRMALLQGGAQADPMQVLRVVVNARRELKPHLSSGSDLNGRLKDVIYLDLALETTARTLLEGSMSALASLGPLNLMEGVALALESLCLSSGSNDELVLCLKEWKQVLAAGTGKDSWALRAKAVMDRIRGALQSTGERYNARFQPIADQMGDRLNVDGHVKSVFSEEVIRGGGAAPLSILLNKLDPVLRQAADLGAWQIISPVEAHGFVEVVPNLHDVQNKVYDRPTVLVAARVTGEEEIPEGVVALLTPDMPDVLSHVSVRARNEKVCFGSCFDADAFKALQGRQGDVLRLKPKGTDLTVEDGDAAMLGGTATPVATPGSLGIAIKKREWCGKWAVSSEEMTSEIVGGKSRNLADLRSGGKLPEDIKLPAQVAMPFGTFDAVLADAMNAAIKTDLEALLPMTIENLDAAKALVRQLQAPPALVVALEEKVKAAGLMWPGDEGPERWAQAWAAICGVWASKYNERAFLSCRKAGLNHADLCMAVLCQEVVPAAYAFVIHTVNPQTDDTNQIYTEVVRGLGETLVGNYPGRALSFVTNKNDMANPLVVGYPSKSVGLFVQNTLIFRSDSNGEDLEGFAGAGLYDSITMDECTEHRIEYSEDPMVNDPEYQQYILSSIAQAGLSIEQILDFPQDLEGCITSTGDLYIVQTRPQV
mmetsp:Transcript_11917/g.20114  ORF Transcript_11917/g.20114 Transcript_11917/m.20114 type:complete len:1364 (+) Transcript_11917:166-4257(+)